MRKIQLGFTKNIIINSCRLNVYMYLENYTDSLLECRFQSRVNQVCLEIKHQNYIGKDSKHKPDPLMTCSSESSVII